jgi:hypothetical protein
MLKNLKLKLGTLSLSHSCRQEKVCHGFFFLRKSFFLESRSLVSITAKVIAIRAQKEVCEFSLRAPLGTTDL